MPWTTTLSVEELAHAIDRCVLVDCRHRLDDPQAGRRAWEAGHIPSAHFLSIDDDLSGRHDPSLGRHPLPDRETLRGKLAALGLSDDTQLVVYDDQGGANGFAHIFGMFTAVLLAVVVIILVLGEATRGRSLEDISD